MPIETLQPKTYVKAQYKAPFNITNVLGSPARFTFELKVEANQPVSSYVLDDAGVNSFEEHGGDVQKLSYGGFERRKIHRQAIRLRGSGPWYLIVYNPGKETAAAYYEVTTSHA